MQKSAFLNLKWRTYVLFVIFFLLQKSHRNLTKISIQILRDFFNEKKAQNRPVLAKNPKSRCLLVKKQLYGMKKKCEAICAGILRKSHGRLFTSSLGFFRQILSQKMICNRLFYFPKNRTTVLIAESYRIIFQPYCQTCFFLYGLSCEEIKNITVCILHDFVGRENFLTGKSWGRF